MQLWTTVPSAIYVYLVVLIVESFSLVTTTYLLLTGVDITLTFEALIRDKKR